jgi:tRNA(His) 5'-end guanylyltransferase
MSITFDTLIQYLVKKDDQEPVSETITQYNNDTDIKMNITSNHKEKILKGMLKSELVEILMNHYGINVKKSTLTKKKVNELIEEIISNNIGF